MQVFKFQFDGEFHCRGGHCPSAENRNDFRIFRWEIIKLCLRHRILHCKMPDDQWSPLQPHKLQFLILQRAFDLGPGGIVVMEAVKTDAAKFHWVHIGLGGIIPLLRQHPNRIAIVQRRYHILL